MSPITVIIPVYNREKLLARCLDSIAAQDYRPVRVIVVDNASEDGSRGVAEEWGGTHRASDFEVTVVSQPLRGASAARMKGFETAFGHVPGERDEDVVSFFDSDDVMLPGMLRTIMEAFRDAPECDIFVWRLRRVALDGKVSESRRVEEGMPIDMHIVHSYLSTQSYAARAGVFRGAGGWLPDMMEWDDWELGIRILLAHPRALVTDRVLAEVHSQSDSITGTDFSSKAGKWERVLDIADARLADSPRPDRDRLRRVIAYRRVILAAHYRREGDPDLGRRLLEKALSSPLLNGIQRLALRWAYLHTAKGLRGAYTIARPFLK